jgi:hypothetical protein
VERQFGWGQFGFLLRCLGKLGSFLPRTRDKNHMGSWGGRVFNLALPSPTSGSSSATTPTAFPIDRLSSTVIVTNSIAENPILVLVSPEETWLQIWSLNYSATRAQAG